MIKDIYGKESARESLDNGFEANRDDHGHQSDNYPAVSAKKDVDTEAHSEPNVEHPFDPKCKKVTAQISDGQVNSSCKSYGSDEEVSISDVESEASIESPESDGQDALNQNVAQPNECPVSAPNALIEEDYVETIDTSNLEEIPNYQSGPNSQSKDAPTVPSRFMNILTNIPVPKLKTSDLREPLLSHEERQKSSPSNSTDDKDSSTPKDSNSTGSSDQKGRPRSSLCSSPARKQRKSKKPKSKAMMTSFSIFQDKKSQIRESLISSSDSALSSDGCSSDQQAEGGKEESGPQIIQDSSSREAGIVKSKTHLQIVEGCSCAQCNAIRFQTKKVINVDKDEFVQAKEAGLVAKEEEAKSAKAKDKKPKSQWGRIMLVEDQYPSSDSEEESKAKELLERKKSKNILNKRLNEKDIVLSDAQKATITRLEKKELTLVTDAKALKTKRAQTFELFMDLDKNNDNFVDRKDLIKYYGMLQRIKGASVIPQYKCKQGHKMITLTHDQNVAKGEKVKLGFTKEDLKREPYLKPYNGTIGVANSDYNSYSKDQIIKTHDDQQYWFREHQYVKDSSPILPGKPVYCCADKGCTDKAKDRKQFFIFCETCSKDTTNYTICQQHASDFIDDEAMIKEEERVEEEKVKKWTKDYKEKNKTMLLFLVLDKDDDGYIQEKEWLELLGCIELLDKKKSKKSEKKIDAEVKLNQDEQVSLKKTKTFNPKDEKKVSLQETYDLTDEKQLLNAFKDSLQGEFKELGFIEFYNLISYLDINPAKTQAKVISKRFSGCNRICKIFHENPLTRRWRNAKAKEKLRHECNMSEEIKSNFEDYFQKSGESKMDLYDFYKIIEKCEVDVDASCAVLFNQHFQNQFAKICCKGFCRRKRTSESEKHVDTFDQIESEKHQYQTKSKLSEQDSLSKVILVYVSVIQFIDLATDAKLFYDMYRYSRIKYTPCTDSRIDWIPANMTCGIEPHWNTTGAIGMGLDETQPPEDINYTYENERSYKIATTAMLISMISTYLVAYSSIIKLFLDNGQYEPHIIKQNTVIVMIAKVIFLTFLGPFYIIGIELLSTIMAVAQMYALIIIGYQGFDIVKNKFMYLFENVLMLDEERAEGLKQQRTIAQLFFENIPMMVVQTMIQFEYLNCQQLQDGSATVLYISYATTVFSIFTCFIDINLQATALDEKSLVFCLNCLQARQGWIPFLHQISTNKLKRDAYDYGRIVCSYPFISARSLYFKFFKFQFTDVSLNMLISELATMGLLLERKKEKREKLKIFIGRSTNLVTLETVLHVYQLVMKQPDIEINLDGINWSKLVENSKKKMRIPRTNDINQVFTDQVQTTQIQNQVRIKNVTNYQKIKNYDSRTPAGDFSLWICSDDENSQTLKENVHEEDELWKHFARMKRLSVDPMDKKYKSDLLSEIEQLEKKRNHYFDIEAQIDEDKKDAIFLKGCIKVQKMYRGYRSRKFFNFKKLKNMRAEILKREIVDMLKQYDKPEDKIEAVKQKLAKEKSEAEEQRMKAEDLTQIRDRDSQVVKSLEEQLKEATKDYNEYYKKYDAQRDSMNNEESENRTLFQRAQQECICNSNSKFFQELYDFEMPVPTKKCQEIVYYMYVILRGKEDKDDLDYSWTKASEMLRLPKKFIEECNNFDMRKNLYQWKLDMLQPEIDNFNLDEQIMISHSKALSLICTWITSIVDSYKALNKYFKELEVYEVMNKKYHEMGDEITSLEDQIEKAKKVLEKSEQVLSKQVVIKNYEEDDLEFTQKVLNQLQNPDKLSKEDFINLDSYECVEHLDKACKNEKLDKNLMCSVGNCTQIFGGEIQLRYHYKCVHPDAIFDMDFLPYDRDKQGNDYLQAESERTDKFITYKKNWIKEDVQVAKRKFVKKNTLFRVMTDDFTDHNEYDEINQKFRKFDRQDKDLEFYQKAQREKMSYIRDALKQIKSSGQLELSKAEKAVKTSLKQIDALNKDDLESILAIIMDKESAKQGLRKIKIDFELEKDENTRQQDLDQLKDAQSSRYWLAIMRPGKTFVKFKFKESMLVSQYWMYYAGLNEYPQYNGSSDPINWTMKLKSAIYPYQEIEYKFKSQFTGNYHGGDRPKRGEIEKIILDAEILTDEITIIFDKVRDHLDYSNNEYITLQGVQFYGTKPQTIPNTSELESSIESIKKTDQDTSTSDFKQFQVLADPSKTMIEACQVLCLLTKNMPKKKDRGFAKKLVPKDKKGFFFQAKSTILANINNFEKMAKEVDKDNIGDDVEKKVKAILESKAFTQESLSKENGIIIAIKEWAIAVLKYSEEISKAKKSLSLEEIDLLIKVIKSLMILTQKHKIIEGQKTDIDNALIKDQLTNLKVQETLKTFEYTEVPQPILRATGRLANSEDYQQETIKRINYSISMFSSLVSNVLNFYKAKKNFDLITKKRNYADNQIKEKEKEIKRLKIARDEIKNKRKQLEEDETVLKKNLIVKNKNWVLEGCMKVLLEDGCNPNIKDNAGETLLIDAIKKKKLSAIELLLQNDCSVTIKNDQGMSPIGQAVTSMNHDALITILRTEAGKSSVHEPQIYDKHISHKILTPVHYLCKLIRLKGLKKEYSKMIDKLRDYEVRCEDLAEKEGVFRQFGRLFSTLTVDMNPQVLYDIMNKFARFQGNLLNFKDSKKNNFLHLISKSFIYKQGDMAHPNYEFIISDKLSGFSESGNYQEVLRVLLLEKNFEGISPLKMMLENNQYTLIKILSEKDIIYIFETEYEEDIVSYLIRFALSAQDYKTEFEPRVLLFKKHFEMTLNASKWAKNRGQQEKELEGKERMEDQKKSAWKYSERLPGMIIARGEAMLAKTPSLLKQFTKMKISGNTHFKAIKGKKQGKKKKSSVEFDDMDGGFDFDISLDGDSDEDDSGSDEDQSKKGDDEQKQENEEEAAVQSDSDEDNKLEIEGLNEEKHALNKGLSKLVRVRLQNDEKIESLKLDVLTSYMDDYRVKVRNECITYDTLPPEIKLNEYIEFMFNLFLEVIALFDMSGDILLLIALFQSEHTAWFALSLLSMLSPFFVCYVPLLTFQKNKLNNKDLDFFTYCSMIVFLTPLVLIYLQLMDVIYIINSVGLVPIAVIIQLLSCGLLKGNMAHMFESKLDSIYEIAFGMSQMDIKGFRRLRTISQLSFESMPQILIQGRILYYNVVAPNSTESLAIDMTVIVGSLACAFFHAIIEFIFVSLEARACKTTFTHYCIVCFNARFGWIPFQNLFSSIGGDQGEDSKNVDYENIRSRLFGQEFDVDFAFSKSTAQVLINCISQLPTEENELKRRNVKIGTSMNDVDMDKMIDLVEMANMRVNLFIDGINVVDLLKRDDSKHILDNIKNPDLKNDEHDSLLKKMIALGRSHIVKEMHKLEPQTDLKPEPFKVAADSNDYEMCKTLINLNDENINNSLRKIENNQCKFKEYLTMGNPAVTASLFSKNEWLVCESYQYLIFTQIMDCIRNRELENSFYLLKALCGPNIPYHLIRGIGMQRLKDDRTKYPSIVEARRKYLDEYRQHKSVLTKFKNAFAPYIYVITKAPKFVKNEEGVTNCETPYKPFETMEDLNKKLADAPTQRKSMIDQEIEKLEEKEKKNADDDKMLSKYLDKNLKQKLQLTSEEAYSFSVLRQKLINEPMDVDRRADDTSDPDSKVGQRLNPLDISDLELDPVYIKIVAQLISFDDHKNVPSLTQEDIVECDKVVERLMLDRQRAVYFSRSRAFNQTQEKPGMLVKQDWSQLLQKLVKEEHEQEENQQEEHKQDEKFYFDENWQTVANLNQVKYNQIVLHPYLEKYKSHVADLRWVQVLYEFTLPPEAIAIKSFFLQIQSYRSIISLNIVKPQYQTSYIISNETDTAETANEIYFEKYVEKDVVQEQLPFPDGFKDVISSVESGDTIKILMSRTQKSIKKELSSYVNNLSIEIELLQRESKLIPKDKKAKQESEGAAQISSSKSIDINQAEQAESETGLKTNELVISAKTDISKIRVIEHKKLFPLLDYVENSKITSSDDLTYFESFFSVGNMSELSKTMTANMWNEYKHKKCKGGFSFKSCIYPGIRIRDSEYGVCAYSSDSYNAFSELFESMILKIHKKNDHKQKSSIMSGETTEQVRKHNLEFYGAQKREIQQQKLWKERNYNKLQENLIDSIKINVRRNLKEFPLCPGLEKEQRRDVMNRVKEACEKLATDQSLEGKFLEIGDITKADREKLGDHVFEIKDRFQIMCGLQKDWPDGRAIYFNNDLSLVIQVNGEDHLDIMYSQKKTSVDSFFKKFLKISFNLEKQLDFSQDDKLGYVTTLPDNLGSSFKIQTIMNVRHLKSKTETGKKLEDIQTQQSNLSEFISENESHVLNIKDDGSDIGQTLSPEQISIYSQEKIGTSNKQAIHKMNLSVNRLIDKENMFNNKILINEKSKLSNYEHLFVKAEGNYGVKGLQHYLTQEIWEKNKDLKTSDGTSFIDCVYPGIKEINSDILLCAGSQECYDQFGDVFNPYIRDVHGHFSNKSKIQSEMNWENMENTSMNVQNVSMISNVRMGIKRNFDKIPFGPSGSSSDIREDVLKKFELIAEKFKENRIKDFEGQFYKLGKVNIQDKKVLGNMPLTINENTTINDENFLRAAQLEKDWPNGRALYVNGDKSFVMKINFIDHLEILINQYKIMYTEEIEVMKPPANDPNGKKMKFLERRYTFDYCDIFKAYQNLCEASALIEETCEFSKSKSLGFLTSLPRDLGYFELEVDLHMPILYKMLKNLKDIEDFAHHNILKKYMVEVELQEFPGYMYLRPQVINRRNVYKVHNMKLDYCDEAYECPRRPGKTTNRKLDSMSQHTLRTKYYDHQKDKSFNRFNKNEKMMVQDVLSCVKELTDQEIKYSNQSNLFMAYNRIHKHTDLEDFESFFVERDKKAALAYGKNNPDAGRPPYKSYDSILKQVMTQEKWAKYKDKKCDMGVPFTLGVFPYIKNRDNTLGLLAGSTSFYQKFHEVYYNFIKEFHDFEPNAKNVLQSEFTKSSIDECKNLDPVPIQGSIGGLVPSLEVDKSFIVSSKAMIKNCKFSETNQRMIKQIKFSVRRNLDNYPFGVQMELSQRVQLMLEVYRATAQLKSDLAGKFYRLKDMRQRDQHELKEFLFKKIEKWATNSSSGGHHTGSSASYSYNSEEQIDGNMIGGTELFSDWPYGRAIYVNKDKSFAIKVGNVDHLEIMSYQDYKLHDKCDIETNFKNLMRGVGHLDNHLKFAFDEKIGYTTSIIKNLGVIDVQIKFAPKYYKFYQTRLTPAIVAKKFNVELDISKQQSDEDPVFLRNKIKFGMTESQIVQDMVNCLQAFFKFEDEYSLRFGVEYDIPSYISMNHLREIKEDERASIHAQWINFESQLLTFHKGLIEDKMYKSSLDKILTEQIWQEYLGKNCGCTHAFSFVDTIVEAIQKFDTRFTEQKLIVAGSQDAYRTFGKFYLNCLKHYEYEWADAFALSLEKNGDQHQNSQINLKHQDKQREYTNNKYEKEDDELVKKVQLSVRRNISGYPLSAAMSKKQRAEVRDKIVEACKEFQGPLKTSIWKRDVEHWKQRGMSKIQENLNAFDVNAHEQPQLIKKHDQDGSAVIYNQDASFIILVNDVDHLEISLKREKTSIPETVEQFNKILKTLDNQLKFAHDDVLGFVTAKPFDLGYISIEIEVELKDLQSNGQDLINHIKGDFIIKAGRKFSKNENENNSSQNPIYQLSNLNSERGKNEHYQIQNMFDCMHEVYKANKKYIQFNKIKKVQDVLGKTFEEIFPPRRGDQPLIFQEKMITKELWDDKYQKGKLKCAKGKTFGACMFPGFMVKDSKMAICAQSASSYDTYSEVFDQFIVKGPTQKEFVCGGYQNIEINPDQLKNVRKIRMTVIRNIAGYNLIPGMNKDERIELMELIEKCCQEFEDDLKGVFYKLEEISESDKKVIQNIYFNKPDDGTFRDLSGQGKEWPSGRAIFTNIDQTFYIHVNNSDHMKITFIKDNVNIQDFLQRFMEILQKIELACKFQFSQKHGYLTTYPYQLRYVSMSIYIDDSREIKQDTTQVLMMAKDQECKIYRSDETGWLVLTNLSSDDEKPATSEQSQIQNTINLAQAILKKMKQIEDLKKGYDEQLQQAKNLKTYDVFMSKPEMKMAQYLTKDMWEEYNLMSCDLGVPFKSIVYPGIKDFDDEKYTLCASSLSCYKLYHRLFERYLTINHSKTYSPNANHPEMVSVSFTNHRFKPADRNLVKQVQFSVRRNFHGIPIGPGLTKDKRKLVLDIVEDICRSYHGSDEGKFYKLDGISDEDKKEIEGIDIGKKEESFLNHCKINDDWPKERGLFVSKDKSFIIKVNFLDHLEITYNVHETGFMESLDKFQNVLSILETKAVVLKKNGPFNVVRIQGSTPVTEDEIPGICRFSYDQKLGYITALPKLINEFQLKIWVKIHESMEPVATTNNNSSTTTYVAVGHDDFDDFGYEQGYSLSLGGGSSSKKSYAKIMEENKFKFIEKSQGERNEDGFQFNNKFEHNVIGNTNLYAISEQIQLQNAINCLQALFDKYAPERKFNPFLGEDLDE